ncbi:MAG TPA: hypothetical protein ENN73_06125 [Firmicutes bacterium]|nr:hypothetical protein [Bacillota bacterium]
MRVIWISSNRFGFEALKYSLTLSGIDIYKLIINNEDFKFIVYDGVPRDSWNVLNINIDEVSTITGAKSMLEKERPDLLIVIGWREIIPEDIISIPKLGTIGFHPTLLPFGRGPAPIINTILSGIKKSGVTMFYLDKGLDSGDIIGQESFEIGENDYAGDVYFKVIKAGKRLLKRYLPLLKNGTAPRIPQDERKVFYFKKPRLKDNKIDLYKDSPELIIRKIRALSKPYLGAYIKTGEKKLRIWKADLE